MKRLRKIRKWGNTHAIVLTKIDMQDLKLQKEDFVDISKLKKEEEDGKDSLSKSNKTRK